MKDIGRIKERHEFSFDSRQLGLVLLAAAFIAALVFVLGVSVGRQWESRKAAEYEAMAHPAAPKPAPAPVPQVTPPTAPPVAPFAARTTTPAQDVEAKKPEAVEKAPDQDLTFPKVLTSKTNKTAPLVPEKKKSDKAGTYTVQVGAYNDKKAAQSRAERLRKKGYAARMFTSKEKKDRYAYKVRIGRFESRDEASAAAKKVESSEKVTPFITVGE